MRKRDKMTTTDYELKCTRIYTDEQGESHFDEVKIPTQKVQVHKDATPFDVSQNFPASRLRITHIPKGVHPVNWHNVPEPVLTVRLKGEVEYETSDGDRRTVKAGEFILIEDTTGKGHRSRHSNEEQTVLWISLPDGLGG
jgi:quercetin dioxygenase-like cupin family protein